MELFAVAPPGTEALLHRELAALGIKGRYVPGGVELQGDAGTIRRVNLESRLASRLLGQDIEMPTGSLVEVDLPIDQWSEAGDGEGRLVRFLKPKELA